MRNTEVATRQYKEQETVKLYTLEEAEIGTESLWLWACGDRLVINSNPERWNFRLFCCAVWIMGNDKQKESVIRLRIMI